MTALHTYISSYFGIAQPSDLDIIAELFKPTALKKGEYFLHTGKQCDRLSFIESGMLRIFVNTDGKEVTQWISTKGYFVTDLSSMVFKTPTR